jgi:glycosyltransferase involved in cell wall biosynthesis
MRILYITTVGGMMVFFVSLIKELVKNGNQVDLACSHTEKIPQELKDIGCRIYNLSCSRSPLKLGNIQCVSEIKNIVKDGGYNIVHCHSPIAGACARIACRKFRKSGLKVIYTAHGFHFYKGAPIKNWIIFYPIEKICSMWTDVLITINSEDYSLAKTRFKAKKVFYVPGVGIDCQKFENAVTDKNRKKKEIGVPEEAFLILSVGELNKNKNHQIVIRAIHELDNPNVHYAIAGVGDQCSELQKLAEKLGIGDKVHLLGHRKDVAELYKTADAYVLPSLREGLNVSLIEAMSSGLPCIVSKIRGNVDLIDSSGGFLCNPSDPSDFKDSISGLISGGKKHLGDYNMQKSRKFDVANINKIMISIYEASELPY